MTKSTTTKTFKHTFAPRLAAVALAASAVISGSAGSAQATPEQYSEDESMPIGGSASFENGDAGGDWLEGAYETGPMEGELTFADPTAGDLTGPAASLKLSSTEAGTNGLGKVTIETTSPQPTDLSPLSWFPPQYRHVMDVNLTITITDTDEAGNPEQEPLVLTTKDPSQLIGKLTEFPPKGATYQLQSPVALVEQSGAESWEQSGHVVPRKMTGLEFELDQD
ncbi:hypothetical protein ACFQS3_18365 [Glycomyces mayteni]|uniref:Secreted protein n=1 Tax=Glycomyces mayteni TaxID=543887 RepID=A0ABW2DD82_9ACTN|nr:hypothetical protein GCM10025732_01450 [Glycomyces mayteni]